MDEVSKQLLRSLLDHDDLAAGLALVDLLHDCGDSQLSCQLACLIGEAAGRVADAWADVPDDANPAEMAWHPATLAVSHWERFKTDVRTLFWTIVSTSDDRARLQLLVNRSYELVTEEYPAASY